MPKEREKRRKTSKEAGLSGAGIGEGFCKERRTSCKASENCDELCQMTEVRLPEVNAVLAQSSMMEVRGVPQVTITPDGGCSQEMEQEDWADVDGPLRRNMSNSSISSTGSSIESEDDILSDNEKKSKGNITLEHLCEHTGESIPWWTLKNIVVNWPFVGSQRRNLSWVQLAGHKGNFKAGGKGTILKKFSENEKLCFERLQGDVLQGFVPGYNGVVERDGEPFLHMTDLLVNFDEPSVMDCKMGVRTYLEEELVRARERPKLRRDLYDKMLEVDSEAPSPQEHLQRAVTKLCYMQWRETLSSTHTLGFRIEGIKKADGTCHTDFKKTRSKADVTQVFRDFSGGNTNIVNSYLSKLAKIQQALKSSEFFKRHEVIGSSLLFIHDHTERAEVWLIDFGKTTGLPEGQTLDHCIPWQEGNREDGYMLGLDNLMRTLGSLTNEGNSEGTSQLTSE
ncbi:inositol-trisphosphate 3-kinase A-like isoform X1 [Oncorhynchus nerka]|uniref:inositol-trisphosphate 3-kinase A-like isoform X1 n=1 Tax=Oncorhynchus nerka TaxID=8023 RepID=UPI001130F2E6|nr:inositol-trisphosphate 3-kinase A-like isoform X1 [Oncorhynchus nerka]